MFPCSVLVAGRTTIPKAAVNLMDHASGSVVTIDYVMGFFDSTFALIASVMDSRTMEGMIRA